MKYTNYLINTFVGISVLSFATMIYVSLTIIF